MDFYILSGKKIQLVINMSMSALKLHSPQSFYMQVFFIYHIQLEVEETS